MEVRFKWMFTGLVLALTCYAHLAWSMDQYSWENDKGETIYSNAPPSDRPYIIYRDGVLFKYMDPESNAEPEDTSQLVPIYSEAQKKMLADRLLLLKYGNEDQIIEEMNVEINHLGYDFRLLKQSSESLYNSLYELIGTAADRQRADLAVDPAQRDQIESVRRRLLDNKEELVKLRIRQLAIEDKFEKERLRYRELKTGDPDQS